MSDPLCSSNIYPSLYYDDAPQAIEFLCRAFGFRKRLVVPGPNGTIMHSELSYGPGVVMVATVRPDRGGASPKTLGQHHGGLSVQVDDPDAHYRHAKAEGAVITQELRDEDYGSRGYVATDPGGHVWYFGTYRPGRWWDGAAHSS